MDVGLRRLLLGDKYTDIGHRLENIIYLELLRRGYNVGIGKVDDKEIDFIAESSGEKIYIQVAASVLDPNTFAREIAPLKKINDNYPKLILTLDELPIDENGIKQVNILKHLNQQRLLSLFSAPALFRINRSRQLNNTRLQ